MQTFPKIPNTELFLTGGCVRDSLLGKEVKDRDFVAITPLSFSEFTSEIEKVGKVFLAKPEFLTVRCIIDREPIDIAFPRSEADYLDSRHPSIVDRVETLEADASRRDFTINAMFMGEDGKVIDFFNGQDDLVNGILQAVGRPMDRFREDPLRILRGVRFACKLGFEISQVTVWAMGASKELMSTVSADRIRDEINGALLADSDKALHLFAKFGVFDLMREKGLRLEATAKVR